MQYTCMYVCVCVCPAVARYPQNVVTYTVSGETYQQLLPIEVDADPLGAACHVVHTSGHDVHHVLGEVGHPKLGQVRFEGHLGEVTLAVLDHGLARLAHVV